MEKSTKLICLSMQPAPFRRRRHTVPYHAASSAFQGILQLAEASHIFQNTGRHKVDFLLI